ncbi:MAG: hypothetical protein ACHQ52_04775 [Candidatus Eisenbacteria bacterium]
MRPLVLILLAATAGATLPAIASAQELSVRPLTTGTALQGLVYRPRGAYSHPYVATTPAAVTVQASAPAVVSVQEPVTDSASRDLADLDLYAHPYVPTTITVAPVHEVVVQPVPSGTALYGLTYQPRGAYSHPYVPSMARPEPGSQGYFDLHGGVFEYMSNGASRPNGARSSDFGAKMAFSLGSAVRLGTLLDWQYRSESNTVPINSTPGPGGTTISNSVDLGSSTGSLVPWMGFLEISPVPRSPIAPYVGIAGGYEWLYLHATRSDIPVAFDANYGGWGWQAWGGIGFRLAPEVRLTGEVYGNFCEVWRNAFDTTLNAVTRETVNVDGAGVRGGLQFLF